MQTAAKSSFLASVSRALIVTLVGLLAVACFFRVPILNGFSVLFGDPFDGRIETTILEHWFAVFGGHEPWNRMAYFYPVPDSLGYNDGYFLYGVIFSLFRVLGFDPFVASELVNSCVHFAGFVYFYLFARRLAPLSPELGLLGAVIFTVANVFYVQSGQASHGQLLTISFTPLLALLIWDAARAVKQGAGRRAALTGSAAALFYGTWLLTGFYMAWFTTFFGIMLGLCVVAACCPAERTVAVLRNTMRISPRWPFLVIALALVLSLLPFLFVYLPKARETGMHPVSAIMMFSPSVLDLTHIGPGTYLFRWLDRAITAVFRPGFPDRGEHVIGFPPALLILAFAGAGIAWFGETGNRGSSGARCLSPSSSRSRLSCMSDRTRSGCSYIAMCRAPVPCASSPDT
jgi:hypothetical protein